MPKLLNLAVFVDADNIGLKALIAAMPAIVNLGRVQVCRVFGKVPKAAKPDWKAAMERGGLPSPGFKFCRGKNATDFELSMEAVHLQHSKKFNGACLLSSDGDFVHVVRRLRTDGVKVHVFGRRQAAKALRAAADQFLAIEDLATPPVLAHELVAPIQ